MDKELINIHIEKI